MADDGPQLPDPRKALARMVNRPIGVFGRFRPFYGLNALQRLRGGPRTLQRAVGGKVVVITGASSGIGEAAARQVAAAGAVTVLVARTREKLEALAAEIEADGGIAHVHPCDLSDMDDIERLAAEVLEQHGRVDVLVNNAGRSIRRSVKNSTDRFHDYQRTMQLNYFGAVRLILALLPSMRERRSGHVVNISSAGVQTKTPRFSGYVASKAALDAFTDCVQAELAQDGIRFTTIHMPLVRTPMIAPTKMYRSFPALSPDEAGEWVCDAITYRPSRMGPPFGTLSELADAVSPASMEAVRSAGYRMFRDSRAARGGDKAPEPGEPESEEASAAGNAFARATRGVHW
jgi:NAD(P)-dependent dehydrogenase (short-subunit alcohol dehydrogenase family)